MLPIVTHQQVAGLHETVLRSSESGFWSANATNAKVTSTVLEQPIEPVFLGYPHGPKTSEYAPTDRKKKTALIVFQWDSMGVLSGKVSGKRLWTGSIDPAGPLHSVVGTKPSGLDNTIYDRDRDVAFTISGGHVKFRSSRGGYAFEVTGKKVQLEIRENYVRDHLGYSLWDRTSANWSKPVMGWCSWMAHLQDVREVDMLAASKFFSQNLRAYGYDTIQMDDGFQRMPQFGLDQPTKEPVNTLWSKPNDKFPSGLSALAKAIRADKMIPGIWIGLYLPLGVPGNGYVTGPDGKPYKGPWVNFAVDGLVPEALESGYLKSVRDLKAQGWDYFKIDTLRHVLYDNYRKAPGYWKQTGHDPNQAFRKIMAEIKKIAGKNTYVLACWGALPELAGVPDGCRIGEDVGPNFDSARRSAKYIAQFHHLNNVVWHNDPDYMCFRAPIELCRTWASMIALTGCQTMVSDPISAYDAERVDVLRRVGPSLPIRPRTLVPLQPDPELAILDASKGGDSWTVVGRMAWKQEPARDVTLKELGLDSSQTYLAYDFWAGKFLGEVRGVLPMHALTEGDSQVVSLRPLTNHPQILGTDRHIGQGLVELQDVKWKDGKLSGTFLRTPGRSWSVLVHVPKGFDLQSSEPGPVELQQGEVIRLTFPDGADPMKFELRFGGRQP